MAVAGEQILTRLGFEVDGISLKSSLEKAAAFGSALRRAFADASAAFVGVAKGEAEVAAQADALGVSVERFAEWRFIAEQTGASADALEASLKAMLANNPGLSDAASELERAGGAMREMGDAQREAYARGLGIDPSLIPMLTRDVSGLRDMFRSLYATAGTDAAKAAEDGKGFLDGMARLAGLCDLLAKTGALSLLGTARSGIEALGDAFVAHFDDIRRVLELVVALASAAAPVIGADDEEIAQSISVIFLFNVIAALIFPKLGMILGLSNEGFGLFAGTAVNDTSSVTAAAAAWDGLHGSNTLDAATIVKLTRTLAIIPITLVLSFWQMRKAKKSGEAQGGTFDIKKIFPFFILFFILASVVTTVFALPATVTAPIKELSKFFIIMAMAAIGFNTNLVKLVRTGGKPIFMGLCCWIGIAGVSLLIQHVLGIW